MHTSMLVVYSDCVYGSYAVPRYKLTPYMSGARLLTTLAKPQRRTAAAVDTHLETTGHVLRYRCAILLLRHLTQNLFVRRLELLSDNQTDDPQVGIQNTNLAKQE